MTPAANPLDPLLLSALSPSRLLTITGPNFSGRTALLQRFCRQTRSQHRMYLGPEIYFALSGLTTTARQELELHAGGTLEATNNLPLVERLNLAHLLPHHPASLSGGEQTALAILCAIILKPSILAADCALEQLDSERLSHCLDLLKEPTGPEQGTIITDNRLDEWTYATKSAAIMDFPAPPSRYPAVPPLNPAALAPLASITAPTIDLEKLCAGYPGSPDVLTNITLSLQPGQIYTLTGLNGSGKSTFAKILTGVLRPAGGQIRFSEKPAKPWKTPGKVAGYHLQNPDVALFESTVVAELGRATDAAIIQSAFGLDPYTGANPLALPFPLRKRVSLAATIAHRPPWIILDEPTLGCDAATVRALAEIIRQLAEKGHGLLIITHSQRLLEMLAATPLMLSGGNIATSR